MKTPLLACWVGLASAMVSAVEPVVFQARTARDGLWSQAATWEGGRMPKAGDFVQIRAGHAVTYDVVSGEALRMIHVAGRLTFASNRDTRLETGLIKIEPGETTTEEGFDCHAPMAAMSGKGPVPALVIGTPEEPIPAGVTATIRLRHFPGTSTETLPAIVACGGRWEVHGAPMARTWLKLGATAAKGDASLEVEAPPTGWRPGDRILVTTEVLQGPGPGATFRQSGGRPKPLGTEERTIRSIEGTTIGLDRPLEKSHRGEGLTRCEVANLSRNVVIESAEPGGVRGHTMYHRGSSGGISYAEFRHLGKEGVLGKYPIHFHLVRDTMRGSGVLGASVWDSHNRWITIHGTDHLLIRDCVGYRSLGHGYFLEDATEQWNVLDRNLAVQAYTAVPLPQQVLPYDPNDGAGFWWANGRNSLTRNAACENDRYGYHFHLAGASPGFDPEMRLRTPDGTVAVRDVRTVPFLRFEDNESHGDGLFAFRLGDEVPGSVRGDRTHPFIARNLRAWESHYALRPNLAFFLLDGLQVTRAAFGIYHPNYDAHVYRHVALDRVTGEPINGGHDELSRPLGNFTYDGLAFIHCRLERDSLIQLTAIALQPGLSGHFRGVTLSDSESLAGTVNFGGGPRTNRTEHAVAYFFHDTPEPGQVTRVASTKTPEVMKSADFRPIQGWTGDEARAVVVADEAFPDLLAPVDDLPPATLITRIEAASDGRVTLRGVSHDNGEVATVTVNGQLATILEQQAGVADWSITLDVPNDGSYEAFSSDRAGNAERVPHRRAATAE